MKKKYLAQNADIILKKAVLNAANIWGLTHKELSMIIGSSESTISRLNIDKNKGINPKSKEGELSLLFIRVFRSLDAFLGNSIKNEKEWLYSFNLAFNDTPINKMQTIDGLVNVVNYLDAIRGKI